VVRLHDEGIVRRVLRHIDELLPFYSSNPKASKELFKVRNLIYLKPNYSKKFQKAEFFFEFFFLTNFFFAALGPVMEYWNGFYSFTCVHDTLEVSSNEWGRVVVTGNQGEIYLTFFVSRRRMIFFQKMYVGYVTNSKVTTTSTWPTISFMASSLVEIMSIKPEVTYQQAFVYIRQMAIHVRNATNQKSKV
jgi:hypothetical protein